MVNNYELNNNELNRLSGIKHLSIMFQSDMTFSQNIDYIAYQALQQLFFLKALQQLIFVT